MTEPMDEQDAEAVEEASGLNGNETKQALARRMILNLRRQLDLLEEMVLSEGEPAQTVKNWETELVGPEREGRMMEGVFDGENMVGEDGRRYTVPPNYASKSKLVEGDLLRLTITEDGKFLYKQRGPIERQRVIGELLRDERTEDWKIAAGGRTYRVLPASVSFFKGDAGDEAVALVPRDAPSKWAAVENIIKKAE